MAQNTTTGAPYLESTDAPDLAGITKAIADWTAEGNVVLRAVDEAERDALYAGVPAPALCVSKERPALWMKVADTGASSDWRTVWSDTGWTGAGFSTSGLQFTLSGAAIRKIGNQVSLSAVVTSTADIGPTTSSGVHAGNLIGDPGCLYLPPGYYPSRIVPVALEASFGLWGGRILTSGVIAIYDGPAGASISAGDNLTVYAQYLTD